jgi:hypothetical protein
VQGRPVLGQACCTEEGVVEGQGRRLEIGQIAIAALDVAYIPVGDAAAGSIAGLNRGVGWPLPAICRQLRRV